MLTGKTAGATSPRAGEERGGCWELRVPFWTLSCQEGIWIRVSGMMIPIGKSLVYRWCAGRI